jgi:hypothetical protein
MESSLYSNTLAYSEVPDLNCTYLSHTSGTPVFTDPMSGSTIGIMMILSTFQWQAPCTGPCADATSQAAKAAYIQGGLQGIQDKVGSKAENGIKDSLHSVGVTDMEMGLVLGSAKVIRDRQISVNGPKLGFIRTHLTITENSGTIGLRWNW